MTTEETTASPEVLIIGAGFAGMYMIHRLRELGFAAKAVDAAPEVGGTWYHNRYPGLRCDVESLQYSYTFSEQLRNEWDWSERYPPQSEILAYAKWVADRLDLRRDVMLETRVVSAQWNEMEGRWLIGVEDGRTFTPRFVILATGALSVPRFPAIPGFDSFAGTLVHTASWPDEGVALAGKRVGLIGTGSSGVQVATAVASEVAHLSIFQRTPAYTIPAHNRALTNEDRQYFRDNFAELDAWMRRTSGGIMAGPSKVSGVELSAEERERLLREAWTKGGSFAFTGTFNDTRKNEQSNRYMADFVRDRIRETVKDARTAELLCPQDFIAARRVCVDTGYYEIFNRDNVSLIDVSGDPIAYVTERGIRLTSGKEIDLDILVLATGYDAITGAVLALDLVGRDGLTIRQVWADGPKCYLGLGIAGFPNMFTVTGPGSPSVLSNVLRSIEHHVGWISDCLVAMRDRGARRIEVDAGAQEEWVRHVNEVADETLFTKTRSWYMGSDIPGKPRVFMPYAGGLPRYMATCEKIATEGYTGFAIR